MKIMFAAGDEKQFLRVVGADDVAAFHGKTVHPVYSTFALARDIEWTTRQFVIEMCEADEEGIGTFLTIDHKSPAFVGEAVMIAGTVEELKENELICAYQAKVGSRLIASGKTGQKILKREKIERLFKQVRPV